MERNHDRKKASPLRLLWLRRNLFLGACLLFLLFGVFTTSLQPRYFEASAQAGFESSGTKPDGIPDLTPLSTRFKHEKETALSDQILLPVITKLKLTERAEFNSNLEKNPSIATQIANHFDPQSINFSGTTHIADQIRKDLRIEATPDYRTIMFHYRSVSPHLARAIVNATAETYVSTSSLHSKKNLIAKSDLPLYSFIPDMETHAFIWISIAITAALMIGMFAPLPSGQYGKVNEF